MEKIFIPNKLNIDVASYQFLSKLQYDIYTSNDSDIILDFSNCQFTHAAFTAYLGALRSIGNGWGKNVRFDGHKNNKILDYFKKSGLYDYYKKTGENHVNKNSIPFTKVDLEDENLIDYIDNILQLAPITLSEACRDSLFKNIYEIFINATEHSKSTYGVFSCGHWMPVKRQLIFSVCDTGTGIPRLVKHQNPHIDSVEAIKWALERGNSTKQLKAGVPRGVGLADLKDFTRLNKGKLIIFSNDVYYNCSDINSKIHLPYDIVGTLVTIVITADDEHIYILKEEKK